jgi:hypothetical protein
MWSVIVYRNVLLKMSGDADACIQLDNRKVITDLVNLFLCLTKYHAMNTCLALN